MSTNPYVPSRASIAGAALASTESDISLSEFAAFTGPSSYPPQMFAFHTKQTRTAGFNGWAAIFGFHWFVLRKLYRYVLPAAFLDFGLALLLVAALKFAGRPLQTAELALPGMLGLVLGRVALGFFANIALTWRARAVIRRVDALNLDNDRHLTVIASLGGVSFGAVVAVFVAGGVIRILTNNL